LPPLSPSRRRLPRRIAAVALCAVAALGAAYVLGGQASTKLHARVLHPKPDKLVVSDPPATGTTWSAFATLNGHAAAWVAERGGVTFMRFDQRYVHLDLHAGWHDGGPIGWTYGDRIVGAELRRVLAAFDGGFKLTYTNVGFESLGHVAVALKAGLASIVTYTDGTTNIGAWDEGVPGTRKKVFSVLQNQSLLIDHGVAAATLTNCVLDCWGGTIGDQTIVARSGLGITANHDLVWAAGEQLAPTDLATALLTVGAVRAIELDINPWWVAGYLYLHAPRTRVRAIGLVPHQHGIGGSLLRYPYSRDFLTVVAN
jgi:hypothetical protein